MEQEREGLSALARDMAEAAGQLLLVIRAMDDLGWTTDSYSRRHLRNIADSLRGSAARIAASQGDPSTGSDSAATRQPPADPAR